MTRSWIVLQHVAWEGPGLVALEAARRGLAMAVRRMDCGDSVPRVDELSGLVVMGGPMGVHDEAQHPHLAAEQQLIRSAVDRGLPVLGVCLGAQLTAAALGARVTKGPVPEIGLGEVSLTAEGSSDPVLGGAGATLPVVHWHEDTFELPPSATHLACSAKYPNQAFRVGRHAYAFQFHVEVDRSLALEWAPRLPPGIDLDEARRAGVEQVGRRVIGRFLDLARLS